MGTPPGAFSGPPEVLAQRKGLVLVGRSESHPVQSFGRTGQPLEQHLERDLAVVHEERHLAGPHFHDDLRAEHAAITPAESGIEEARVVSADLPGPRVIDDHLGGEIRGYAYPLLGDQNVEAVRFQDVGVAAGALDGLPELGWI